MKGNSPNKKYLIMVLVIIFPSVPIIILFIHSDLQGKTGSNAIFQRA